MSLLKVSGLNINYPGWPPVINRLNFAVERGEAVGLVGKSGSGKTQTALAIMGLLPRNATVAGEGVFDGENILGAPERTLNQYRTRRMSIVFQDPMSALNRYFRFGDQPRRNLIDHDLSGEDQA